MSDNSFTESNNGENNMSVTYFEHYPHYTGTMNVTIKFTDKEFDNLVDVAKQSIKSDSEAIYDLVEKIEKENGVSIYALVSAFTDKAKRPKTITKALKKKGVWADEWEEGSHAFSTKGSKSARKAVGKIEAKHVMDEL